MPPSPPLRARPTWSATRAVAALGAVVLLAVAAPGCTDGGPGEAEVSAIQAHAGTGQIWVRTEPGAELALLDRRGNQVAFDAVDGKGRLAQRESARADGRGALVLRGVAPDGRYVVTRLDGDRGRSRPVTVLDAGDLVDDDVFADQEVGEGHGYLTTRDGTQLAVQVRLPGPVDEGPYPTVVELSAGGARPGEPGLDTPLGIAAALGFATVAIDLRGTGCSGGSFELWEEVQALDGYDAVQVLSAQPWVSNGRVGMVGVGDAADTMLGVAALDPPGLAAIAPIGVFDDAYRSVIRPGGVPNATAIAQIRATEDAAASGTSWARARIEDGDSRCARNQALRGQTVRRADELSRLAFAPAGEQPFGLSFEPAALAEQVKVPTFLVTTWQDERAGGHGSVLVPALAEADQAYVTLINGNQGQALAVPSVLQHWYEFLALYVGRQAPHPERTWSLASEVGAQVLGEEQPVPELLRPEPRFPVGTSFEAALAEYERDSRVRVLFDVGGAPGLDPGLPVPGWEEPFGAFPPPEVRPATWYLSEGSELTSDAPTARDDDPDAIDEYRSDPAARPALSLDAEDDVAARRPAYDWSTPAADDSLSYVTPVLLQGAVVVGSASADLWIRSSATDTDLQVTISEVRPDGQETYVQSGWLRASQRALDEGRSTALQPHPTQLEADAAPLEPGRFTPVRVEVAPFAHAFRVGSRIRVTISAPGGDSPRWRFTPLPGVQDNAVARSVGRPSALVLPLVPGASPRTDLPACPALRGQPCRAYVPRSP